MGVGVGVGVGVGEIRVTPHKERRHFLHRRETRPTRDTMTRVPRPVYGELLASKDKIINHVQVTTID